MSLSPRLKHSYLDHYEEFGYAVVKGVFGPAEVRDISDAFDRIYARAISHPKSLRHQNVFFQTAPDPNLGRVARFVQWPSYIDTVLNRFRLDRRMLEIVEPLLGTNIKQIINQLHWKPPGAERVEFGFHQDIHFRRPREAYRNPHSSYVQTAIAVDSHREENGAIRIYPESHKLGELSFPISGRVMEHVPQDEDLRALGLDPANLVDLDLDPGDIAIWNLYTVHGSGPNTSQSDRRVYINGYARARDCDRGEWAFRNGEPCSLGQPALIHFEDLFSRPEPHYVEDQ